MEASHVVMLIAVLLAVIGWMGKVLYTDVVKDIEKLRKDINYLYSLTRTPEGEDSSVRRRKS